MHFEINRNAKKFKAPYWWLAASIKVVSPLLLAGLFTWNIVNLFVFNGGTYNPDYPIWAQIAGGWAISGLVFLSGFIAKIFVSRKKKKGGYVEDEVVWDAVPAAATAGAGASGSAKVKAASTGAKKPASKKKKKK